MDNGRSRNFRLVLDVVVSLASAPMFKLTAVWVRSIIKTPSL